MVRTTPTPASFSSRAQRKCINSGCDNTAETHSVYCSDKCITKHAQEAINLLHEERKKRSVSSHKPTTSHSSGINVPMPWESQQAKTPTSPQVKERVAVIERSTGRVIAGVAAPAEQDLVQWLHRHPTFEVIKPSVSKEVRKKDKKEEEKAIRDNVKRTLKDILSSRLKEVPELKLSPEDISRFSINIEEDLYKLFGEAGPRYKSKYRSLAFNLKDFRNKVLFHHVLSGEVPTDKLVGMTAEQLASQELARWRERETKHTIEMIKQNQLDINASKGHIKKTHKGEIELDEDEDLSSLESRTPSKDKENSEVAEPDSNTSPGPLLIDTTDQHRIHLFDLNCRICTGKMQPPGEPPRQEDMLMLVSTTTPIQALAESSVPSPPPVSVDITSVSSTDSYDVASVSPPTPAKPVKRDKPVWKGYVMMQSVSKFSTNAYKVSGPCDDLLHLLPDTLHLQGRIGFKQVWGYIEQLRHSTTRDVSIVRYEVSSDDEKTSYVSLYSYFYSRKRCGVVSNCYTGVKDMYLVPLASHAAIPSELLPFDGPEREVVVSFLKKRKRKQLLFD
ncbi:PHD finger protein 3 [Exaiptasia diaphana]|nr:PHD finger protein 3 [Exaiptasia diaphana]